MKIKHLLSLLLPLILSGIKLHAHAGRGRIDKDGTVKNAGFNNTDGIGIDSSDNLYITDSSRNNGYIRKLSTDGTVSTFCKHS